MRLFTIIFSAILLAFSAQAQINYPAALCENVTGTYTDLGTNGSVISTANFDNANSTPIPIGFNFQYNGATHSHFILNTNGFIKLGINASMTAPTDTLFFTTGNSYTGGPFNSSLPDDVNLIVAFNHDLIAAASGAEFRTQTSGAAGSRVCTIQFKNMRDKTTAPVEQLDSLNFQIKLYETTNVIEFIYGNFYSTSNASAFKSGTCGLKGTTTTDLTVATKGSTQAYSVATFLDGNYTGNAFNFGNDNLGARPLPDPGRTLRFTPAFPNDVKIDNVQTMGGLPIPYGLPHTISARITNVGVNAMTNFRVYLDITGANLRADSTGNIASLASGNSLTVSFTGFSPDNFGINNVSVYVKPDDNIDNDKIDFRQEISDSMYSYIDTANPTGNSVGFNTGSGLILAKHHVTGARRITGVDVFLSNTVAGNGVYAVVMSSSGAILDQSNLLIATTADNSKWHHFEMPAAPLVTNADFYIGLAQTPNTTTGYFPVGVIAEVGRAGAYYSTGLTGSPTPTDFQTSGLDLQPAIRGYVAGNDIKIENITGVPKAFCGSSNETIDVVVSNADSTLIDFSIDTLDITVSTTAPISQSFTATVNSGTLAPGATMTIPVTNNFDLSTPGSYTIKVEADITMEVTPTTNTRNFKVDVITAPSVTISVSPPLTSICYGDSVTFRAVPTTLGSKSYQWKIDGVNAGPVTTDSLFGSTTLLSSKVSVDLVTEDCDALPATIASNEIEMTVSPEPILAFAGPDTVLENSTESYFFPPRSGSSFLWSVTGGVADVPTGNSANITWGTAGPGKIEIYEQDNKSCEYTTVIDIAIVSIVGRDHISGGIYQLGNCYPNPTNGMATIDLATPKAEQVTLSLYTLTGKKVKEIFSGQVNGHKKIRLNTQDLEAGIYFYEMNASGYRFVKKMTIIE